MKRAIATLVVAGALVALTAGQAGQPSYPEKHISAHGIANAATLDAVKKICDKAHKQNDSKSEQACGNAQDVTGTEYLCSNFASDAICWVEEL